MRASLYLLTIMTALAALGSGGCSGRKAASEARPRRPPPPRVELTTPRGAEVHVAVELARSPETWSRGLMGRKALPAMSGMYFILPRAQVLTLWMKDTLIPLDMIFIDDDHRVIGIVENAAPMTLTRRSIGRPSRYVLEVNGGFCAKHGVTVGTRVRLVER